MEVVEISDENLEGFGPLLGADLSEDVKRAYFGGIGLVDENGHPEGALVYELLNSESEEDTKSRICLIKSEKKEARDAMLGYYCENAVQEEEIVESFYTMERETDAKTLEELGFSMEKREDENLVLTLGELGESELGKKYKIPDYVDNIESLTILQYREAVKQILFKGHTGNMEDIPYLPKIWFDNNISACVSSGGKIPGLFLIRRTPSGVLIPALLFAYGPEFKKNLVYMIQYSVQQALQLYPKDTKIKISRKNPSTRALTDKLLPNRAGAEIFYGERKE